MKTAPPLDAIGENIIATYLRLGSAVRGAECTIVRGVHLCTGPIDHPVCNFAIGLESGNGPIHELVQWAESRPFLNAYLLPSEDRVELIQLLRGAGFRPCHQLVCMHGTDLPGEGGDLVEQSTPLGRRETGRFMASQFMTRSSANHRHTVAEATATADELRLFRLFSGRRTVGAVMVSESPQIVGIYNLCVAPSWRGKGLGTSILRWASARARSEGKHLTLQCEPLLQPWYEELGFESVGNLRVFTLARAQSADIMKT